MTENWPSDSLGVGTSYPIEGSPFEPVANSTEFAHVVMNLSKQFIVEVGMHPPVAYTLGDDHVHCMTFDPLKEHTPDLIQAMCDETNAYCLCLVMEGTLRKADDENEVLVVSAEWEDEGSCRIFGRMYRDEEGKLTHFLVCDNETEYNNYGGNLGGFFDEN